MPLHSAMALVASALPRALAEVAEVAEAAKEASESVASRTGVQENGPGDLKALISALFLNSLIVIGCLIGFTVLRMSFPLVYSHRLHQKKDSEQETALTDSEGTDSGVVAVSRRQRLKTIVCDWFCFSINTTTEDAVDRAGLDAVLLREFCRTGALILATVAIPMCLIIVPINSTLGEADEGVHAILVWFVCLAVHFHLDRAQAKFLKLRVQWLQNLPAPRSTSVLVENIPSTWRSDDKLREYFGTIFSPEDVAGTHMVKLENDLAKLVAKRETLVAMKRKAEMTFEKTEQKETFRPKWCGEKVDVLQYCEEQMTGLDDQITALRREHEAERKEDPTARTSHCGFVTFKGRRYAEIAQNLQLSANKKEWQVSAAPEVSDLRWDDLRKPRSLKMGSELVGYACCVGLYIGFMPIVGFVTNLGMAVNMGPLQPIWEGFAPTLGLTIFLAFLPTIFMAIFRTFFVLKSDSFAQHKLQFWFFLFQLIFVVLVTTVGKSIITQFQSIADNPKQVFQLMADSLPKATHFYMTYIVLQWSVKAKEMLRYVVLSKFMIFKAIFSPEEAKEMAEPEDQDSYGFGARNVNLAVSVVLGLLFCSMSPLVTVFAMMDLLLARVTYGYLVIFAETKKPDLGGVFWVTQVQFVQLALALYCIFMVGVLMQKSPSTAKIFDFEIRAWMVAAPSLLIVLYSYVHISQKYQWRKLPYQEVAFGIDKMEQSGSDDATGDCYIQPELSAVEQLTTLDA
eukprot:CAMPEP_0114664764 /NCGR_PEP_ID=MMETSP0191-20121206/29395_1 /TAXON_ID=126664 /ORGANISM="Sorites sp." /LENGTH=738 /DNA_ID=CAMNT_0001907755 /DNA_START=43 /DNA_END=2259 /DNA_ORIENTATION=-